MGEIKRAYKILIGKHGRKYIGVDWNIILHTAYINKTGECRMFLSDQGRD
jgi:hypothetical protein